MNIAKYYEKIREAYRIPKEASDPNYTDKIGDDPLMQIKISIGMLDELDTEALHKVMQGNHLDCTSRSLESLSLLGLIKINYETYDGVIGDKVKFCNIQIYTILAYAELYPNKIKNNDNLIYLNSRKNQSLTSQEEDDY